MSKIRCALKECRIATPTNSISTADGGWQWFCLPDDFVGFQGHFPEYPIVPAVVQVLMAQIVAEEMLQLKAAISAVERSKFHRQLHPDDIIGVHCVRKIIRGKNIIAAQLFVDEDIVASFWLIEEQK